MDKKKLTIILGIIVVVIAIILVIIGIVKKVDSDRRDYEIPLTVEYNYYKVYVNGKYGMLNKKGELVVPANYDDIITPNPSKAVFICQYNYDSMTDEFDYIILNDKAEELFKNYENVEPISVTGIIGSVPYEKFALSYKKDGKYGLLGIDGNKICNAIYEEISSVPYKEGVFLIKENGKFGVMNNKGVVLINPEYDSIIGDGYYDENTGYKASCFIARKGEFVGYFNELGETILENEYDSIHRINELNGKYVIAQKNGQYGLLNDTRIIIGFNYQEITYDENTDLIKVKRNRNYGVLNKEGNKVLPLEFGEISFAGIYIYATRDDIIEKYTVDGEPVTNDLYTSVNRLSGEYYISIDKKYDYGLLDQNMNVVIGNQYEYLDYVSDKLIIARNSNGKYGIVDIKEKTIVGFDYDVMQLIKNTSVVQGIILGSKTVHLYNIEGVEIYNERNAQLYSHDNYINVISDKGISYFDANGNKISNAEVYPNNKLLSYNDNNKWGFKDRAGNVVVNATYDNITELNKNGFAGIKSNGKWGVIDETGKVVVEPTYEMEESAMPDFLGIYYKSYSGYQEGYYTK